MQWYWILVWPVLAYVDLHAFPASLIGGLLFVLAVVAFFIHIMILVD